MKLQLVTSVLAALAVAPAAPERAAPYDRAMQRAIDRAEGVLLSGMEIYESDRTWQDPWVVETDHYVVRTARSYYFGLVLGQGLETMLSFFQEALRTDWVPRQRLNVFILPDLQTYNGFGDTHGAEHSSFYGSFYAGGHPQQPIAALYDSNFARFQRTLTHSATHQFVAGAFPQTRSQPWVSEGLAKYFELHWDFGSGIADFRRIQADNNLWIPLPELLGAPLQNYGDRTESRLLQLGALFTYLYSYREDTRTVWENGEIVSAPFGDYMNALLSGRDVSRLAPHRLLTRQLGQLNDDLRSFTFE